MGAQLMIIDWDVVVAIGTVAAALIAGIAVFLSTWQNKRLREIEESKLKCNVILYCEYYKDKLESYPLSEIYRRGISSSGSKADTNDNDIDSDECADDNSNNQKYVGYAHFCIKNHGEDLLKDVIVKFNNVVTSKYSIVLAKNEARHVKIGVPTGVEFTNDSQMNQNVLEKIGVKFISGNNKSTSGEFSLREIKDKENTYTIKNYSFLGDK